ncbi:heme d1 biosynthesis radical SAM protein NirJ [Undibacterium piscinae]|jgi:heme d1 biosynthesis radical SAM protein NirJ|uniref:Pre-heme d1 synthase n=1 Tax=Undibacterium piscinae TaxID=2495591 RepID=A0A6M4A7R1_9BURK|nr:heme d1 biosynthesis radical SAM protein NirJ [Undibacterium piscinae]
MFRISQYMREIASPTPLGPKRNPPGPVVIWNLIRRCNLTCKHCYSISADKDFAGELSTAEVNATMDDLKDFRVPVLILSGGEPLLRPDIYEIARRAKQMGFYVGLSTNGTLIDESNIAQIAEIGFDYVGISLDGMRETHDEFRRKQGAFDASLHGVRLCRDAGIKIGVRFTLTQDNAHDLPALLKLVEDEGIDKFYLSHLNYAGRGNKNRGRDAFLQTTRNAMDLLFDTCWDYLQRGLEKEFVTGNNDADGVYLLQWVRARFPEREAALRAKLAQWGGNSSGVNVANIDNLGVVHPDTFWWHYPLGNVRERKFSDIWTDVSDPLMAGLKAVPRKIKGRCGECSYFDVCGGNTRVRALQLTDDPWQEDPACYLSDEEIGVSSERERVTLSPYIPIRGVKIA